MSVDEILMGLIQFYFAHFSVGMLQCDQAQHLITPCAAGVNDTSLDFPTFPEAVIGLVVLESDVEGHRNTYGAQRKEGNGSVYFKMLQPMEEIEDSGPIKATEYNHFPSES
jgi:hypothetical protein